jgi:hypothetical protein
MDPRVGLDDVQKRKFLTLPGLELRPFGRYPGSPLNPITLLNIAGLFFAFLLLSF